MAIAIEERRKGMNGGDPIVFTGSLARLREQK
jgi:hypothetical protein